MKRDIHSKSNVQINIVQIGITTVLWVQAQRVNAVFATTDITAISYWKLYSFN